MILKNDTSALLFWGAFVTKTRFVVPVGELISFMGPSSSRHEVLAVVDNLGDLFDFRNTSTAVHRVAKSSAEASGHVFFC